jgi:GTP-binding protein HflX
VQVARAAHRLQLALELDDLVLEDAPVGLDLRFAGAAEDMLFATLDPTMRRLELPSRKTAILSDTVGFISDLPTHLVAAFRATLEEVVEADLVLHLRDISDSDTAAQAADVERILADLGVDATDPMHVIEVWNKIDRLNGDDGDLLQDALGVNRVPPLAISAVTGEGIPVLLDHIEARIAGELERIELTLPPDKLGLTDLVYRRGTVLERHDNDDGSVSMQVLATAAARSEIEGRLGRQIKG